MHRRRLLLFCNRSLMRSLDEKTCRRSLQTSAAELFYLRHLRSAACASSGSQRSPQTSLTILVAMPLLFLTAIDVEKGCKYLAWAVMCHTFLRHWRECICYMSFAFIVLLCLCNFHCKAKKRCQMLSVLLVICCMHKSKLEICISIFGGTCFPLFPPEDNNGDEDDEVESLNFSDTSLSDEPGDSDDNDDSDVECSPCIDSSLSQTQSLQSESCDCSPPVDTQPDDESIDSLSDVSDNSDIFHVAPSNDITYQTLEDTDIEIIDKIKQHLRSYPLLPAKERDATGGDSFENLSSGMQLSLLTCGFLYCNWQSSCSMSSHRSLEQHLYCHLRRDHKNSRTDCIPQRSGNNTLLALIQII